jgi:ABC-2 type transport system ATP-binding protein
MIAIEARGLEKAYGDVGVLRGVDLSVAAGSVFALLGPNGAGKTTTVRILATLLAADAGSARVAGFDVTRERARVRAAIALTGQHAAVDELQTGTENLAMMGRLRGLSRDAAAARAAELLARFDLVDAAGRRVGTYSGGMRRRLDLAAGLVVEPQVLFLDEPTTGLDPRSRAAMWDVIAELVGDGMTVFLTTQYLEEADRLADRIAVVDGGRIVAEGTAAELKARVGGPRLEVRMRDGRLLTLSTDGHAAQVRALLDELDPARDQIARFAVREATLDDVFLTLTAQEATHV